MQERKKFIRQLLIAAPLGAALLVAGCSSGGDDDPAPVIPTSGNVVQGPVSGATVFADVDKDGIFNNSDVQADAATDATGAYTFSTALPAGDYVLTTAGGIDILTGEAAYKALAPKGAKNITPLTTLVASVPAAEQAAVKALINNLVGDGYDIDLSRAEGVPAEAMKVAKSVESTLKVFADLGVTTPTAQIAIFKETAKQMVEASKTTSDVNTLLGNAVAASAAAIAADTTVLAGSGETVNIAISDTAAFANIVKEAVTQVNTAITTAAASGTITETKELQTQLTEKVTTVVNNPTNNLTTIVQTVAMKVAAVRGYAAATEVVNVSGTALDSAITAPASISSLVADLTVRNDYTEAKNYPSVSMSLVVKDNQSARQAILTVADLNVTVAAGGTSITVNDAAAKVTVTGVTRAGDIVTNLQPFPGPFSGFAVNGKTVTFNLDAIGTLIESKTELSSFANINEIGSYTVSLIVGGAPVASRSLQVNVVQ